MDTLTALLIIAGFGCFTWIVVRYIDYKKSIDVRQINAKGAQTTQLDINAMFDQVDTALNEARQVRAEMAAKKASPEQLAPLDKRIGQLEWVENNQWWLRYATPYIDSVAKILLRMLK